MTRSQDREPAGRARIRRHFSRAVGRSALGFLIPPLALLVAVGIALYGFETARWRAALRQREHRSVEIQRAQIFDDLATVTTDLVVLSRSDALGRLVRPDGSVDPAARESLAGTFGRVASVRRLYDQIRVVSRDGRELLRLDFGPDGPQLVPDDDLQNESGRETFEKTIGLDPGEVFVSALDLSVEKGGIQRPLKPVIRFGTPVPDEAGEVSSILLLNYLARPLLDRLSGVGPRPAAQAFLLNSDGYFLRGPNAGAEWGFALEDRADQTFARWFPSAWPTLLAAESGQLVTMDGLVTFTTTYPLHDRAGAGSAPNRGRQIVPVAADEYSWRIVSFIPGSAIAAHERVLLRLFSAVGAILASMLLIGAWRLAIARVQRHEAEVALVASEARNRGILLGAVDAIVTIAYDGRITAVNPAAERLFDRTAVALIGLYVGTLLPDPDAAEHGGCIWRCFGRRTAATVGRFHEVEALRPDGTRIPVEISLSESSGGTEPTYAALIRDVGGRKRAEQELRVAAAAFDSCDPIVITDCRGLIQRVNPAFTRVTGFTSEEAVGQTPRIRKSGRHDEDFYREMWSTLGKSGQWRGEVWNRRKSGEVYPESMTITAVKNEKGNVTHYVAVGQDVTEKMRSEIELKEYARKLERINRELDDFTQMASHDLQEPLRKLQAFSDLLEQDLGDATTEEVATDLKYIRDGARRMGRLVQDLLALARAGRTLQDVEVVALDTCIDDALDALTIAIREKGAELRRTPMREVKGSRTLLTQLFQNLIGNALKFTGDRKPVIAITVEDTEAGPVFGVLDNGIGIPKDDAERVFAPFHRLHGRLEYEGSGIGLAVCRKTVDRHGGRIWVESIPGEGSHFRFTLGMKAICPPVRPPAAPGAPIGAKTNGADPKAAERDRSLADDPVAV